METKDIFRKVFPAIVSVVGFGPLIAEGIKRWADRNGYLDDPSKGLQWALTTVASLTEWWWFYYALCFFVGLILGLWLDRLMRVRSNKRSAKSESVGHDMQELAHIIRKQGGRSLAVWPDCFNSYASRVSSVLISAKALGLWTPTGDALRLEDDGFFLHQYFDFVGRMLVDGHIKQAKQLASDLSGAFQEQLNAVTARLAASSASR
jgi:hypothetical protein